VARTLFGILPNGSVAHLYPQKTWKDEVTLDETLRKLVGMFQKNFTKYEQTVDAEVRAAAPEVRLAAE
jgi:phosphoenolpyruvate carboxykinase (ATP)